MRKLTPEEIEEQRARAAPYEAAARRERRLVFGTIAISCLMYLALVLTARWLGPRP